MKKEIIISLKGIKTKEELFKKLYQRELKLQTISGHENNLSSNWDAFSDDLSALDYPEDVKDINVIFTDWLDFERELPQEASSFLSILAWNTDSKQRVDGRNFTFQVRLE
jgi:Barstar (barnase inhibitor)